MGDFRPGDWSCEQCGDHQFERNLSCRKCGAPKPIVAGNQQVAKLGDWICPGCKDLQFERNAVCRKCGTPKPHAAASSRGGGGGQAVLQPMMHQVPVQRAVYASGAAFNMGSGMGCAAGLGGNIGGGCGRGCGGMGPRPEGDWICTACGDLQFGRNTMCRKCGAPKPKTSSNNQIAKVGDWICPNPSCQDVQFERNSACRRCNTPRPFDVAKRPIAESQKLGGEAFSGPADMAPGGAYVSDADWTCPECGSSELAMIFACRQCGAPKPKTSSNQQISKKGDWICPNPNCQDVQFERNAMCRRCQTPKPAGVAESGLPVTERPSAPLSGIAPEDWMCAECGDLQFARNLACRKCGAPSPKTSTNNQIAKRGDWICPNPSCGDVQFERNQVCRRCATPKPMCAGGKGASMMGMVARPMMAGPMMAGPYSPQFGKGQMQQMVSPMLAGKGGMGGMATVCVPVLATNKQVARAGDWVCPNPTCKDVQFERNQACRKCGTAKPLVSSNRQVFKQGDWICPNPDCRDVQFERNHICRKCSTPKPEEDGSGVAAMMGGTMMDGSSGGFGADGGRHRSRSPVLGGF